MPQHQQSIGNLFLPPQGHPLFRNKIVKKKTYNLCTRHQKCTNQCLKFEEFNARTMLLEEKVTLKTNLKQLNESQFVLKLQEELRSHKLEKNRLYRKKRTRRIRQILNSQTNQTIRLAIQKMTKQKFKPAVIASCLNIPLRRVLYVKQINKENTIESSNVFCQQKEHTLWVQLILQDNQEPCSHSINELYKKFIDNFSIYPDKLKAPFFYRCLKRYCNVSYKLPSTNKIRKITEQLTLQRYQYSQTLLNYKVGRNELIYLDESSIEKNQNAVNLTKSCTVLGAMSDKGYLAFQIFEGTINSEIYPYHLQLLLREKMQKFDNDNFYQAFHENLSSVSIQEVKNICGHVYKYIKKSWQKDEF